MASEPYDPKGWRQTSIGQADCNIPPEVGGTEHFAGLKNDAAETEPQTLTNTDLPTKTQLPK